MAEISLPVHGEKDWGNKLNAAVNAVNDEAKAASEGVGGLEELVTNGRLSESMLERFIIDDGEGRVPDSSLPSRLTVQGISQTVNLAARPFIDAVADIPGQVEEQVDDIVPPAVISVMAADGTIAAAAAEAVTEDIAGRDILEASDPRVMQASANERYRWAVVDSLMRAAIGVTPEGAVEISLLRLLGDLEAAGINGTTIEKLNPEVTGLAFAYTDENGRLSELAIGADGRFPQWVVDSFAQRMVIPAATPDRYKAIGQAKTVPIASGPAITLLGDSLTASGGIASKLASLTGKTTHNMGVGGETALGIAARYNAMPFLMQPVGGVIPASGEVDVTFTSAYPGGTPKPMLQGTGIRANGDNLAWGTLAGVRGRFYLKTKDPAVPLPSASTKDVYSFLRATAGDPVVVNKPTAFLYEWAEARRSDVLIAWMGQNGPSDDISFAMFEAVAHQMNGLDKRFLFATAPGVTNPGWTDMEKRMLTRWGRRFVNYRRYLIDHALADLGLTPTEQDLLDMAAGTVPTQLRTDAVHHTQAAQSAIAEFLVFPRLKEMGWL